MLLSITSTFQAQVTQEYLQEVNEQLIKMDDTFNGRLPEYTINGKYKLLVTLINGKETTIMNDFVFKKEIKKKL